MKKRTLNLGITIVVSWLLMSCGSDPGNTGPTIGSESHFLETCVDGGCPSGLACVCGVCTTACDAAGVCGVEGATCQELPAFADALSCTEGAGNVPRVCAFECAEDADCAPLGQAHICSNGLCQADATFVADDVEPDLISECAQPSPLASSAIYACNCGVESSDDCVPGDDGAAGTATAPLQTLEAAIAATDFSTPGTGIALCRGGGFELPATALDISCSADAPCLFHDYYPPGTDEADRPVVLFSEFDGFDLGPTAPVTGVHVRNLRLVGNAGEGIGIAEGSEALLVCGMEIMGFDLGVHFPQITETTSDVTVRDSEFVQNRNEAIQGGANDLQILSSTFVENGFPDPAIGIVDLSSGLLTSNIRVEGNTFGVNASDDVGRCNARMIQMSGIFDDVVISGNSFGTPDMLSDPSCRGVVVGAIHDAIPDETSNLRITENRFENFEGGAIGLDVCDECEVANNVVIHRGSNGKAIAIPSRMISPEDTLQMVTVRNNSVYVAEGTDVVGIFVSEDAEVANIVSNAVQYDVADALNACYDLQLDGLDGSNFNLCWSPSAEPPAFNLGFADLAEWRMSGNDADSIVADPLFTSLEGAADLSAASDESPLVDAGDPDDSSPTSIDGDRTDGAPDIGAHEFAR